ncbi:MAG: rhomboid family intramembrane serine protease [Chloroflexota bacterium]
MDYKPDNPPPRRPHPLEGGYPSPQEQQQQGQEPRERLQFNIKPSPPQITYAMIAINVAIFIFGMLSIDIQNALFLAGWNDAMAVFNDGEFYRLFTAMFLHAGLAHIFFNAYALYILGIQTEQMYGKARYLSIYLLGGVTGSVLSAGFGDPNVPSVGASGAVFALLGTQIVYFYRNREELGDWGRGALRQYLLLLGINLLLGFSIPQIDNLGHIGGLIGGAILGFVLAPNLKVRQLYDYVGNSVRMIDVEQRSGWETISVLYAVGLVAFTVFAGLVMF